MKINQRFDLTFYLTEPRIALKLERCIKTMHEFTDNVIEKRHIALEKSIADGSYKPMGNSFLYSIHGVFILSFRL